MMTPEQKKVRLAAMNLLSYREHSRKEIRAKLRKKDYDDDLIDIAIESLCADDLLSEVRFAEGYIRYRSTKGYGPQRISLELIERGLVSELIDAHLNPSDQIWFELVDAVAKKKFGPEPPVDFESRCKRMRFLQYRGFTNAQISVVFDDEYKQVKK